VTRGLSKLITHSARRPHVSLTDDDWRELEIYAARQYLTVSGLCSMIVRD